MALLQEAAANARDDGQAKGPLVIGSMETTIAVRLPEVLGQFNARHPAVELVVRTGPTAELIQSVIDNEVDGAFVAGPIDHPRLKAEKIFDEELVLVRRRGAGPDLAALRNEAAPLTALMFRTGRRIPPAPRAVARPARRVRSYRRLEFGTLEGILGCVGADVGVTLLPRYVVARSFAHERLVVHEIDASISRAPTLLVTRRDAFESTAMRMFRRTPARPALRQLGDFPVSDMFEPAAAP